MHVLQDLRLVLGVHPSCLLALMVMRPEGKPRRHARLQLLQRLLLRPEAAPMGVQKRFSPRTAQPLLVGPSSRQRAMRHVGSWQHGSTNNGGVDEVQEM